MHDPVTSNPCQAIVMELVHGVTLSDKLKDGPLSESEVRTIAFGLVDGVDHIHNQGITHEDIHDENVLLVGTAPKIIDIFYRTSLTSLTTASRETRLRRDLANLRDLLSEVIAASALGASCAEAFRAHTLRDNSIAALRLSLTTAVANSAASARQPAAVAVESSDGPSQRGHEPTSTQARDIRRRALAIIRSAQSGSAPVSACVAEALELAIDASHTALHAFCERELTGHYSTEQRVVFRDPTGAEHRVASFFSSFEPIDLDFFENAQAATQWMEARPRDFFPIRFVYPKPISQIERDAAAVKATTILAFKMPANVLVPDSPLGETPVFCYAKGDVSITILERTRAALTARLLQLTSPEE